MSTAQSTSSLERAVLRSIVPAGASAADRARIAHALLDLVERLGHAGGMKTSQQHGHEVSVEAAIAAWDTEHTGKTSAQQRAQVASLVRDLAAHAGQREIGGIRREDVSAFLAHVQVHGRCKPSQRGRHKAGVGGGVAVEAKTLNDALGSIRSFLRWCEATGRVGGGGVGGNAAEGIAWFGGRRAGHAWRTRCDERAFTADEVRRLIAAAPPARAVLYRFLAETGLRIGTVERLTAQDFVLRADGGEVTIDGSRMKSGVGLSLPLSPELADMLEPVLGSVGQLGREGEMIWPRRPHRRSLDRDQKNAGIALVDARGRKAGFHAFRRFVGTELRQRGVDLQLRQARLGHADPRTTLRYGVDAGPEQVAVSGVLARVLGAVAGAGTVAPATGAAGVGGRVRREEAVGAGGGGVEAGEGAAGRERWTGEARQWALQGSKPLASVGGPDAATAQAQPFAIEAVLRMLLSGCSTRQAALVLRAVAQTLINETAAADAGEDEGDRIPLAPASPLPPSASAPSPLSQAG